MNILLGTDASREELLDAVVKKYRVTGYDLGVNIPATYDKITYTAFNKGLKLCHDEVIPQLRLQYRQSNGEKSKEIATRPFDNGDGCPIIFSLVYVGNKPGLMPISVRPHDTFNPDTEWIFV